MVATKLAKCYANLIFAAYDPQMQTSYNSTPNFTRKICKEYISEFWYYFAKCIAETKSNRKFEKLHILQIWALDLCDIIKIKFNI